MSNITVVAYDPQPGDSLCSLPAICALAEKHDTVWLEFQNAGVLEIAEFPANVRFGAPPIGTPIVFLGVAAAINYRFTPTMLHPTQHLMKMAGLDAPPETPRPRIKPWGGIEVLPEFDVILAPFTTARERTLTEEQVYQLNTRLAKQRVALLGGGLNPKPLGMMCYYNYPFAFGAELLRKAKVVVTVDSFPNRLAHAVGVKSHIILDSGVTPPQWQGYPGAIVLPRDGIDIIADKVLELLAR